MEVVVEYCETESGIQYRTAQDIINTVSYVINPEDTFGMVRTIGISLENYLNEILLLKEAYGQTVDRHLVHVVVSSQEFRFLNHDELMHMAFQIGMFYGKEYQVIFGVHPFRKGSHSQKDTHIHYIINSVNYTNGKYLFPDEYKSRLFKRHIMELYRGYGLQEYYELRKFR
jgi:hypothetical protein